MEQDSHSLLIVGICDDDPIHLQQLELLTDRCLSGVRHRIFCYTSSKDLLDDLADRNFALILMDIQLKGENGITVARRINQAKPFCNIIFVSAYLAYAQDVYDAEHVSFVTKHDMESYLPKAIASLLHRQSAQRKSFIVQTEGSMQFIVPRDIIFLEHNVRSTTIHLESDGHVRELVIREKIEDLLGRLDDNRFVQCHKSFAFNWNYVQSYDKSSVTLKNGRLIPISRNKSAAVMDSFKRWSLD